MDIGSLADWTAAVFTGAGFGAAIYQLRSARLEQRRERKRARQDEQDRHEAMARAVGVKINWGATDKDHGTTTANIEVLNAGPYPIDTAVLFIEADERPMGIVLGTIFPGELIKDTDDVPRREVVFGELTAGATLRFTDTYGNFWARTGGTLEREEVPPRIC